MGEATSITSVVHPRASAGALGIEPSRGTPAQGDFARVLGRAGATGNARDAAEQFVAIALVQPVLSKLRESNGAAGPFKPNAAERTFRSMLDATLARRIVGSSSWALVDSIARRLEGASMEARA